MRMFCYGMIVAVFFGVLSREANGGRIKGLCTPIFNPSPEEVVKTCHCYTTFAGKLEMIGRVSVPGYGGNAFQAADQACTKIAVTRYQDGTATSSAGNCVNVPKRRARYYQPR